MQISKLTKGLVVSTALFSVQAHANVIIDFDSLGDLTQVGSAYASDGILFDDPGFQVLDNLYGAIIVPSSPNYVDMSTTTTALSFVDPLNALKAATTSFFEFDNLGLQFGSGFFAGLNVVAKSLAGDILDTATISPSGPNQSRSVFTTRLEGAGIHSIEFTLIPNPQGGAVAGIDNIRFADVTPVSVPEPATISLIGLSLFGLLRRRGRTSGFCSK